MEQINEISLLLDITITFLKFFVEQYEADKVKRELFIEHTGTKIDFIKSNIDMINSNDEKEQALWLLRKCNEIYSEI